MKTYYYGLDVLRGFGIFTVLILHSAFYYFDGIYEVDFNNASLFSAAANYGNVFESTVQMSGIDQYKFPVFNDFESYYYIGGSATALLVLAAIAFIIIKRKKKRI